MSGSLRGKYALKSNPFLEVVKDGWNYVLFYCKEKLDHFTSLNVCIVFLVGEVTVLFLFFFISILHI